MARAKSVPLSAEQAAQDVRASVAIQRRITGASGVPESAIVAVAQPHEFDSVDNPLMTDAEFISQRRRAEASGKSRDTIRNIGKERVLRNMQTYLGAFGKFKGTDAQVKAAAKFKALHDQSQIGGGRACDPSVEPVDGGGINPESVFEIGADARRMWIDTTIWLGRQDFDRFHAVVIEEVGPTAYAKRRSGEIVPDGRTVSTHSEEVRQIAQRLAERWGYDGKPPQSGSMKAHMEGERLSM